MLAAGIGILISHFRFKGNAVEIDAKITDIVVSGTRKHRSHTVYVTYQYDGETYEDVRFNEYDSGMRKGKTIKILIDPEDPEHVSSQYGMIFAGGVLIFMGVIFFCIGFIPLMVGAKKKSLKKRLMAEGRCIFAKVESVTMNTSLTVNGRHPYVVYCNHKDEYRDVVYRFKSGNIWENPEYCFEPGSDIRVYVNGDDYSKYYVDVESVMENKVIDYT